VLGRGPGLGPVLEALRGAEPEVTAIVATAEAPGAGRSPEADSGAALADVRRSLEALSGDDVALSRAMGRPLTVRPAGRRPLGNLLLQSLSSGFGDLGEASLWLGAQLGIQGRVVPATSPLAAGAIREADVVLLAPGGVSPGSLVAGAPADIGAALAATPARVIWISDRVRPEAREAREIRIDGVLDPASLGDLPW
jgi:2-phospho-L-lactate transferase/gluconeogenesis factor (CofD/UPF0052 family)